MSLNDFEIISKIGDGTYSTVFKVRRHQDNTVYALKQVKLLDLPSKEIQNAVNEVRILASIHHPNVIGYREAFYDKGSKSLCVVMEYADGGDLLQKIVHYRNKGQYFEEWYIWDIFGQVVSGLAKLHELGILHRDIKTANIFLMRNGVAKIGDMNVSKVVRKSGMCETQTGTPYYASPQVWRDEAYDSKSDIWSLGCILYQFINLKLPFRARDMEGLYKKVSRGYYSRINKSYSEQFSEVLKQLIRLNPKERMACRDVLQTQIMRKNMKRHKDSEAGEKSVLLRTIRLSKNINYLTERLPKSNYAQIQEKCHYYNRSMSLESVKNDQKLTKSQLYSKGISNANMSLPPIPPQKGRNSQVKISKIKLKNPQKEMLNSERSYSQTKPERRYKAKSNF